MGPLRRRISPRLPTIPAEDPLGTFENNSNGWLTGQAQVKYDEDQMSYVVPFQHEYKVTTEPTNEVPSDASILRCRRKIRLGSTPPPIKGSVIDFEQTSTVQAPTEMASGDYTSNISVNDIKREYFHNYRPNTELPIYEYRSNLINSIKSYSILIVEGATGCGKTTQVPCYILEDAILNNSLPRAPVIYVTQPRRIAAKSIAQRVCDEHNWTLGSIVGYQVGLDKVAGPQTILTFVTAGVLLQKLIQDKSLKNYTHIIIDEAHERDADTDLLMMMIRTLMRRETSFFRLIIMSATMDITKLRSYFTFPTNYGHQSLTSPSICMVSQDKRPSTLQVVYLDALRPSFNVNNPIPTFDIDNPEIFDECLDIAVKLIVDIIPHIDNFEEKSKSTLCFLPGLAEIGKLHRLLKSCQDLDIIPLHSCLSAKDQIRVFEVSPPGRRKVILATNIAESSITVKDVGFIIDFCLTKTLRKDQVSRFPTLKLHWSSVDKCIQRAGRTGRCCNGKVFRMVTHSFFKTFKEYAEPELLVAPLELSVLRVKNFQMGEIKAMFAIVLDPPPLEEIRTAVLELKQIGAMSSTYNGRLTDLDGDLTELGRVISTLPIDVHLSKLIVMASVLDVVEDAIIVAACLSTNRTVVRHQYGNSLATYSSKLDWAHGSYSDLFVCLDVFKEYISYKDDQRKSSAWLDAFCLNNNLDDRKLYEVSVLVEELKTRLEGVNIKIVEQPNRIRNKYEDELMLKVAFCASFYPNYFLTEKVNVDEVKKALCGQDPTKTVIVHGLPVNSVPLYKSQIVQQFYEISNSIEYIADNSRALLVLNNEDRMPNDHDSSKALGIDSVIANGPDMERCVYLALKHGETCDRLTVWEYTEEAAQQRMQYYHDKRLELKELMGPKLLPPWLKIVDKGTENNSEIIEADESDYVALVDRRFYIEVDFNEEQDKEDAIEIYRMINANKNNLNKKLPSNIDAPIFKAEPKPIRGPYSPINMKFRSVLEKSKCYSVDIDPMSVNSILLNPDYERPRRQMLVSASVSQSRRGKILARDTTLMPNIRGLPTLMALMFAQYYKLVYNNELKCIAGAVFGLGWDKDDKPIDKNYEVEFGFDVQIGSDDIKLINKARQLVSNLIRFIDIQNPGKPQAESQETLREIILTLIKKKRFPVEEISFNEIDWTQRRFTVEKHNVPENQLVPLREGQTRVFLPIMNIASNYSDMKLYQSIRNNLETLDQIDRGELKTPMGGIKCLLCDSGLGSLLIFRYKVNAHIHSDAHIHRLMEFEIYEERARLRCQQELLDGTECLDINDPSES